jgi:Domain of unknown function (DUF4350)
MSKKAFIITALIILTITSLVVVFVNTVFVKYEKEISSMPSVKAIKNPFLAAERFLGEIGKNAQSLSDRRLLIDLPGKNDLIIINNFGGNLPEDREEALISWIKSGGSLVITADRLWDEELLKTGNNLLDRYDIRPEIKSEEMKHERSVVEIELGVETKAKISFLSNKFLIDPKGKAEEVYAGENGNHMVQIKIGQGKLIVLSDNSFLKNKNIDKNDHAYFLAYLVKNRSKVWLMYSSNMPSLLSLIWGNASLFVISFLTLLLLCILRLNLKSGPMLVETDHRSRNLMEHLEASGNFYFKLSKGEDMLKKIQKFTELSLTEKFLFNTQITPSEKSSIISKQTNIPSEMIYNALFKDTIEDENDFINKSAVLQQLIHIKDTNIDFKNNF